MEVERDWVLEGIRALPLMTGPSPDYDGLTVRLPQRPFSLLYIRAIRWRSHRQRPEP